MTASRPAPDMAHYVIDARTSRFTVRAFAGGMLSALGHNPTIAIRNFSGEVNFDPAAPERASIRIDIIADSLEVTDEIKSKDRREMESTMHEQVLQSAKYATIVFASTATSAEQIGEGHFRVSMQGSLSLRGATGTLPLTAQVALNGDMLRGYGEFSILQSDYGVPLVSLAGGALKLKDELKFTFDIVARKQE